MAFTLVLESPASVETVQAAIREETREWREAVMPPDLRSLGHLQVASKFRAERFTLRYGSTQQDRVPIELVGVITPLEHGSRIEATCGRPSWWIGPTVFCALGGIILFSGGTGGLVAVTVGGLTGLFLHSRHVAVSREGLEGRYLADRLEKAVASVSRAAG